VSPAGRPLGDADAGNERVFRRRTPGGIRIVRPWNDSAGWFLLLLGGLLGAPFAFYIWGTVNSRRPDFGELHWMWPFLLAYAAIFYVGLSLLNNETTIDVDGAFLRVRHGPLPTLTRGAIAPREGLRRIVLRPTAQGEAQAFAVPKADDPQKLGVLWDVLAQGSADATPLLRSLPEDDAVVIGGMLARELGVDCARGDASA
jgi:hypothetical protein